ncbi:putative alcohol dehydrogenase [Poronia punctata]|nr:putative alcohol dehydrogenase [Poronia punctata]
MSTTRAIVILEDGYSAGVRTVPRPRLRDGWVIVSVKAINLNPTDWKHVDYGLAEPGCRLGCDYAGIVQELGPGVSKFKPGDRIAGSVHGGDRLDHENGAFAETIIAKPHTAFHIPETMGYNEAATMGVAMITTGLSLYHNFGLPFTATPDSESDFMLVYGGSTSTALVGIQFAKVSGLTVVATCSPHNFDHVRMAGADVVFDHGSSTCASDIKAVTRNTLQYAWDCTGSGEGLCAEVLTDAMPATYITINPKSNGVYAPQSKKVDCREVILYDVSGDEYIWGGKLRPASPDSRDFMGPFMEHCYRLFADRIIKPPRYLLNKTGSGLAGALKGLDQLRAGKVSAARLVYTL